MGNKSGTTAGWWIREEVGKSACGFVSLACTCLRWPRLSHIHSISARSPLRRELRLRNYVPEDEDLKRRRVPQAKPVAVEEKVREQLEAAKPEPVIEEVDLANLAPRKPDWDLKRDVAKKLEKLEKRTQRAIAELIRERLKGQEDSLASAVDATNEQEACDSD
ncbi:hypothetical protein QTO34_007431 [Cnephaeus nilssonii]|uniref:Coiled-coil domain containing 12 n=1 Tax=Cnephaeus nilssonii TaxID=3371016 RepID=A0AA40HK77_CNENI|nr:hypothetical protein QTO34_007431 [Eptesicus nilssonii]